MNNTNLIATGMGAVVGLTLAYKLYQRKSAEATAVKEAKANAKNVANLINGLQASKVADLIKDHFAEVKHKTAAKVIKFKKI